MQIHDFSVYDIFQTNARRNAHGVAVSGPAGDLTFQELLNQVDRLARGLAHQGVGKGDRIAVLAMNHTEYLVLYGAAAAAGAVLVPVNWRLSLDEITYILDNSGSQLLFFDESQAPRVQEMGHGYTGTPVPIFNSPDHDLTWQDLMQCQAPKFSPAATAEDLFCLIYTAAVDGHPRGAALSHGNMVASNLQTGLTMGLTRKDVYLNMVPLFHITGMNLALTTLHVGGRNVIMEKFNAPRAIELSRRHGVTLLASFPPILSTLLENMHSGDLSTISGVTGIDAPDTIKAFTEKTGACFWVLYGQSETSGFVTLSDHSRMPGAAGQSCPVSCMAILNDGDEPQPAGTIGEIGVRGPVVFQGFWQPGGTLDRSSFSGGWHHTGDMGRLDNEGFLWFEGRKPEKELIKPGGENVYPAEVEAVVLSHPDIEQVCVIGVPDKKFGEGIKAVCLKKKGASLDAATLIDYVGQRIARYKKPRYVEFIAAPFPCKADGTPDRMTIKKKYGNA